MDARGPRLDPPHTRLTPNPAESLRFDPQGMIESAPEIFECNVGGQLHDRRFGKVPAQGGKQLVRHVLPAHRQAVCVLKHQPLDGRKRRVRGVRVDVRKLLLRDARRLARGGVDIGSERASVQRSHADVYEVAEDRGNERRLPHRLRPRPVRAEQRGVAGPDLGGVQRRAKLAGFVRKYLLNGGRQRRVVRRCDAAHTRPPLPTVVTLRRVAPDRGLRGYVGLVTRKFYEGEDCWSSGVSTHIYSHDEHRVSEAVKAVFSPDRLFVRGEDPFPPGERAHKHQERRSWEVEVGDHGVGGAEPIPGCDE